MAQLGLLFDWLYQSACSHLAIALILQTKTFQVWMQPPWLFSLRRTGWTM